MLPRASQAKGETEGGREGVREGLRTQVWSQNNLNLSPNPAMNYL